jgi:hypothetical protein
MTCFPLGPEPAGALLQNRIGRAGYYKPNRTAFWCIFLLDLARPHGVFVHDGILYVGDSGNHRIRALEI